MLSQSNGINCNKEEQEIAKLLLAGDMDSVFRLFEGVSTKPSRLKFLPFERHRANIQAVKGYFVDESKLPLFSVIEGDSDGELHSRLDRLRDLPWRSCDLPLRMPHWRVFCVRPTL